MILTKSMRLANESVCLQTGQLLQRGGVLLSLTYPRGRASDKKLSDFSGDENTYDGERSRKRGKPAGCTSELSSNGRILSVSPKE